MSTTSQSREKILQAVIESTEKADSLESWGMPVEAVAEYTRASRQLTIATTTPGFFFDTEKELLLRIAAALEIRAVCLQEGKTNENKGSDSRETVDFNDIRKALQDMIQGEVIPSDSNVYKVLPTEPLERRIFQKPRSLFLSDDDYSLAMKAMGRDGNLIKRRQMIPGRTYLTITIDKIGMKDPHSYIDPHVTIIVADPTGRATETQDTPVSARQREEAYIPFGIDVEISTALEDIPRDSAIFFEFKHFKPKKHLTSVKCFSLLEMDEIKPGRVFLEIYKKPTDLTRKRLSLLSVKPLYFHVNLVLHKI